MNTKVFYYLLLVLTCTNAVCSEINIIQLGGQGDYLDARDLHALSNNKLMVVSTKHYPTEYQSSREGILQDIRENRLGFFSKIKQMNSLVVQSLGNGEVIGKVEIGKRNQRFYPGPWSFKYGDGVILAYPYLSEEKIPRLHVLSVSFDLKSSVLFDEKISPKQIKLLDNGVLYVIDNADRRGAGTKVLSLNLKTQKNLLCI